MLFFFKQKTAYDMRISDGSSDVCSSDLPIEIEGLTKAFRRQTADAGFCRIGSAKSNVGHLVIAAGATGVIKTALSLQQRCIPARRHFNEPHPSIAFAAWPRVVNAAMTDCPDGDARRREGGSTLGVGGTNAHVVWEEAPARGKGKKGSR